MVSLSRTAVKKRQFMLLIANILGKKALEELKKKIVVVVIFSCF